MDKLLKFAQFYQTVIANDAQQKDVVDIFAGCLQR